jgi:uncharacterized membrane protein HdeD (DUF308 family)
MKAAFTRSNVVVFERLDAVRRGRGWFIALGAALMILGVLAVAVPFAATLVTTIFLGWLLIVVGIVHGVHALRSRTWQGFPWEVLSAALHLTAGVLLIAFPIAGTLTLTLVLAALFTAEGLLKTVRAVQHRGMPRWGFLLFDGLITLALGILVWTQWPAAAVWLIGLLVGVHLLVGGMSMLFLAASARRLTRASL